MAPDTDPRGLGLGTGLLLGVLLYGCCVGVRSSRQLERRCHEDIAFRVLAANQLPDHVTIARFRVRHETALAGFLVESLKLCATAGLVQVGTVALDGTKLAANAADMANRTHDQLEAEVAEILRQAAEADQHEDRLLEDGRGDQLPEVLASKTERLARLRHAKAQLEAEAAAREQAYQRLVAAHTAHPQPSAAGGAQPQGDRQHHRSRQPLPAHRNGTVQGGPSATWRRVLSATACRASGKREIRSGTSACGKT